MTNNLNDPYSSLERDRTSVRTADGTIGLRLGTNDYQYIKTTHGRKDTLQRSFYILLNKLVTQLKNHGIGPNYSPDEFERALNGATIILGPRDIGPGFHGGTVTFSNPEVSIGNDGRRVGNVAQETPGLHNEPSNLPRRDTDKKPRVSKGGKGQGRTVRKPV